MRDYKREPLKRGELIPRSELFNRYIMENRTYEWCTDYFNVSLLKLKRCLRIYGITKPIILKQQAIKRSNLNHYGVSHPRKETIVNDRISNKVKQTCMQRYGVENVSQLQSIKEKIKKTKEENSNHSHCRAMSNNTNNITTHSSSPSSSHVHYFQTEEFKNKSISTCKKKYNVEYYTQSKEFIQNRKDLMNIRYKAIPNISIAKGVTLVDTLFTWIKSINDNRSNNNSCYREDILLQATNLFKDDDSNTYKSTIDKKVILKCLQDKYGRVTKIRKNDVYPFDYSQGYYVPLCNLYIELRDKIHGHGEHPFDPFSQNDIIQLFSWAIKADKKRLNKNNKYLFYVITWIENDVVQREYAKRNHLNWIEFFSTDEFMNWYKQ